ncbi:hypothetical protein FRB95_014449 [Tulasnella sp. JGI-2019a]|nr:hypothetical protein FRB93_001334 [Tulasnella sp. JGI-2019a]KAG9022674.1 hypothetical protein FRB95_014449 [Tulasnella sp. JGI-2019a]
MTPLGAGPHSPRKKGELDPATSPLIDAKNSDLKEGSIALQRFPETDTTSTVVFSPTLPCTTYRLSSPPPLSDDRYNNLQVWPEASLFSHPPHRCLRERMIGITSSVFSGQYRHRSQASSMPAVSQPIEWFATETRWGGVSWPAKLF